MTFRLLVFLAGVVFAAIAQVLMKKGAMRRRHDAILSSFVDRYTLAGYALMLSSTVTSTIALRALPLKLTVSLLPLGYVLVVLLSRLFLAEQLRPRQWLGMLILLIGIILFHQRGP
jgi:uncharacterized membrane protein